MQELIVLVLSLLSSLLSGAVCGAVGGGVADKFQGDDVLNSAKGGLAGGIALALYGWLSGGLTALFL